MTTTPHPPQDALSGDAGMRPVNTPRIEQLASGAFGDDAGAGENEDALLGRVCQLLITALPVAGAAVTLVDERLRLTAAAANPGAMRTMIAAQFEHGEGPCLDACRTGEPVVETDLAWSRHWAAATGWRAVHTLPVRIDGRTAGVATLASVRDDRLTPTEISTAQSISAIAAAHASTLRALRGSRQLAAQLQRALNGRVEIEQATGVVAHQLDVTVEEALAILRRHTHDQGRHLVDIAHEVVAGSLRLRRREDEGDIVIARDQADAPAALEHPADAAGAEVIRSGVGWPPNHLSIVGTGKPGWARLIGEADLSTEDQLADALERLARQPGDITLDVGDLRLIDARSIGLLVRAATALSPPDRLVLRHATGIVAKVFALLDIGDHPRITIA
ncbi:MAG TPA: GAF domain-containing protein [Euzebyales bacterium]|nr:GAF domain-containing protein [Euzebyales bacterium]